MTLPRQLHSISRSLIYSSHSSLVLSCLWNCGIVLVTDEVGRGSTTGRHGNAKDVMVGVIETHEYIKRKRLVKAINSIINMDNLSEHGLGKQAIGLEFTRREHAIQSIGFFEPGISETEVRHFRRVLVRGWINDAEFDEGVEETTELSKDTVSERTRQATKA